MIHKFKTLGLAIVAVLAMSALVASAAQAQFTANSYPTDVTATGAAGNGFYNTEGGSWECAEHIEGQLSESSTTLTVSATYTQCRSFGFASATVNTNGCDYTYHSNGEVDLECPAGKAIAVSSGSCEVLFGTQTGLKSMGLSNNGGHIDLNAGLTGIAYTVTKDGFLCPFNGTGAKTGATYTHNAALTLKPVSGGTSISID